MELLDALFDNAFFRLPVLEAMMYLAVIMAIGAGIVGLWKRLTAPSPAQAEEPEFRKAA